MFRLWNILSIKSEENKMTYKILVGVDRDNTINQDRKAYFGCEDNWRDEFEFVPGAVEGLRKLSENPDIAIAVLTNQVGIAKGVLTEARVQEMHKYMDSLLREQGVQIDSWQYNSYTIPRGAQRWEEKGVTTVNYDYIVEESDPRRTLIKPDFGLLRKASEELGLDLDVLSLYVVGDRSDDVLTGINAGGVGILVNNPEIVRGSSSFDKTGKVEDMLEDPEYAFRVYIVDNMVEAAQIILDR